MFCSRIKGAEIFAETLPETAALMPKRMQGPLKVGTVNCNQSRHERLTQVSAFKEASLTSSDKTPLRAVLTNCMIFAEGVDVPAIDAVLFTSPKTSTYQIVQAVGRALPPAARPGQGRPHHRPHLQSPRTKPCRCRQRHPLPHPLPGPVRPLALRRTRLPPRLPPALLHQQPPAPRRRPRTRRRTHPLAPALRRRPPQQHLGTRPGKRPALPRTARQPQRAQHLLRP
ncbi:helicase-related protein [Streptomyces sp. NPDC005708]|uniref:helicase-related protein n=1 Tax=Streptomyces sp. NPDC005708 TaxID=3154564 RepID=UPI0033F41A0B